MEAAMFQVVKRVVVAAMLAVFACALGVRVSADYTQIMSAGDSITYPSGYLIDNSSEYKLTFGYTSSFGGSAYLKLLDYGTEWDSSLVDGGNCAGYGRHQNQYSGVGTTGAFALMQYDDNFVLYDSSGGTAGWSTLTASNNGAYLSMQTDGNLVVYSASNAPLWSIFGAHSC
jgi:hypothetical protein